MNKSPTAKIFTIIVLGIGLAIGWGILFYTNILPKENFPSGKDVLSYQTSNIMSSSHSLQPLISNQWYTSMLMDFPSHPLYAMPLVFKTGPQGLSFSYPEVQRSRDTIFAPYSEDFTVGLKNNFKRVQLNNVGDWTVNASLITQADKSISFTLGHGIPFTTIQTDNEPLQITFKNPYKVFIDNKEISSTNVTTEAFMIITKNRSYIYAFPKSTQIELQQNSIRITPVEKMFVGVLDKPENFALFKENSKVVLTDSQASPQIADNKLTVLYKLTSQNGEPLIALYPHQYDLLPYKHEVVGTYQTIRGELRLIKSDNFTLSFPLITPDGTFKKLKGDYPDLTIQIKKDIQSMISGPIPASKDYFLGTWFGKASNLLLLADIYDLQKEKQELLEYIKPVFRESLNEFEYDKSKTSVIAKKPEFGNEELNDHHFHYGYYIRTAAVISSIDLTFLSEVKPKIDEMVADIATLDRGSMEYPYIRNFDVYEAHSWADGKGDTPDGNNQESSSEAISTWYSLLLWGKVTNDANLQKNALYLYNMESQSAAYYWFNKSNIYGNGYGHAIASIVWGGKVDFTTWFSKETNMIYGIQLLPVTPASVYLGNMPDFMKYERDFRANGGSEQKEWGDLYTIWKSFYYPEHSIKSKNTVTKPEGNTPRSVFLYMLYLNSEQQAEEERATPPITP